ncbi:MAG: hypothetical protein K2X49_05675 [Acetobacteraceae bacterium]|nr:hypothetical protein [Acetobacteraceae bacterium]
MKVFFHIGAGKTGTSAIQVALAKSRGALAEAGLHYPELPAGGDDRAARGEISSGNARLLAWFCNRNLAARDASLDGAQRWIADSIAAARGRDLVFSSEAMQSARPDETREMLGLFQEAGYVPEVIFYVRHLLDHAVAEYLQHVKMGFATLAVRDRVDSLASFLPHYRCRYLRSLRPFADVLPREAVHVRLYDAERPRLVPNFFALIGAPPPPAADAQGGVVNRSPTPEEVSLFETVARQPDGTRLCRALSDLLLNSPARSDLPFTVAEEDFERFAARNQAAVAEVNAAWLPGPDKLLMRSDRIRVGTPAPPPVEQVAARFGDMMATVLRSQFGPRPTGRQRPPGARAPA